LSWQALVPGVGTGLRNPLRPRVGVSVGVTKWKHEKNEVRHSHGLPSVQGRSLSLFIHLLFLTEHNGTGGASFTGAALFISV
jgi:hypothetical protein